LKKKGWSISDESTTLKLFHDNYDAFPALGGDTERAAFYSELSHSKAYIANEKGMEINKLQPCHIASGIATLRENNINSGSSETTNPMASLMKMFSTKKIEDDFLQQSMRRTTH
jgi:hypothetical protein